MKTINFLFLSFVLSCSTFNKPEEIPVNSNLLRDSNVFYFGNEYEIVGTLIAKDFYGPPNFGDTPDIDQLEHCCLIMTDSAIDIIMLDTVNSYNLENKYKQSCFQIICYNTAISRKIDIFRLQESKKNHEEIKISLRGYFDSAITGHHHTDVLFIVK